MKLCIILSTDEPETCWNALRLGQGVEIEKIGTFLFDVTGMARQVLDGGGAILACGTCLKLRESAGSELCPLSTMDDLYQLVAQADKVLTF